MYKIYRYQNRAFNKRVFHSYEDARHFLRAYIRKNIKDWKTKEIDMWNLGDLYRTPSISIFGYSIRKS